MRQEAGKRETRRAMSNDTALAVTFAPFSHLVLATRLSTAANHPRSDANAYAFDSQLRARARLIVDSLRSQGIGESRRPPLLGIFYRRYTARHGDENQKVHFTRMDY